MVAARRTTRRTGRSANKVGGGLSRNYGASQMGVLKEAVAFFKEWPDMTVAQQARYIKKSNTISRGLEKLLHSDITT